MESKAKNEENFAVFSLLCTARQYTFSMARYTNVRKKGQNPTRAYMTFMRT